jgi:hypothetical protein
MEEKVQQHVCIYFCFCHGEIWCRNIRNAAISFLRILPKSIEDNWMVFLFQNHLLDRRKYGRWSPMSRPCWLRSSTMTGWFTMSMSLEDRRYIRNSTKQSCTASATLCADIALRSGAPAVGSCTMTMSLPTGHSPQMNFWQHTTFRPSQTLHTRLTLLPVTSSCSRNWRKQWKVTDLITLKRFKPTWWDNWGLLQKVTTRGAFVSGRNTGISAYKHKDTTLKETRPISH